MSNIMNERLAGEFTTLLQSGSFDSAIEMAKCVDDYKLAEEFIYAIFKHKDAPIILTDAVLESFYRTRESLYSAHGDWVRTLSFFINILWKRRLIEWIKKYYDAAFQGARTLKNTCCCDRLIRFFGLYSQWNDDPREFALTKNNLEWVDWTHMKYAKARIDMGKFDSEESYLRWQLTQREIYTLYDLKTDTEIIDTEKLHQILRRLQEIGIPLNTLDLFERNLLTTQLQALYRKLEGCKDEEKCKALAELIQTTGNQLGQI